ncbi:MAG: hypothetical protein EOP83_09810 [Verrucomicrobiaceae bacterium]|nr:MAG: hypothetical protein EOP83_09810 [Verrucomicrobiaceae bacterium]
MSKLILTDIDDTCLEFATPFQDYAEAQGIPTFGRLRDLYSLEAFMRLERAAAIEHLKGFALNHGHEYPAEVCAKSILPQLHADGYKFVAITACGLDPVFRLRRVRNLEDQFGFRFDDVHVVDLGASKAAILAEYPPSIWVEDHFGHAVVGAELGHRAFLLDRAYNRVDSHPLVTRVKDWHEIAEILGSELDR